MSTLLHVQASPRGRESFSNRLAEAFTKAYVDSHPDAKITKLALFGADLPAFDAPAAEAKYSLLSGRQPKGAAARVWRRVVEAVEQLRAADVLVISSPMWNFSIPYPLKQYLDVIVQPALTFSYSPQEGYTGLLTGKPAVLLLARGGDYSPGSGQEAYDMQRPYLEAILRFIGFTDIRTIVVQPTLLGGPEVGQEKLDRAIAEAADLAKQI